MSTTETGSLAPAKSDSNDTSPSPPPAATAHEMGRDVERLLQQLVRVPSEI
jgi:hypothetical protein